jgi:hypothetical protein
MILFVAKVEFDVELSYIKNLKLRNICEELLDIFNDDFYGFPSALGGNHHPEDEHGNDGYIRHIKKVAYWVFELSREHGFSEAVTDCMLFATFFHDIGRVDSLKKTYWRKNVSKAHCIRSRVIVEDELREDGFIQIFDDEIKNCISLVLGFIETHMSHWEESKGGIRPKTTEQVIFATADYCASRREVNTPFLEKKVSNNE